VRTSANLVDILGTHRWAESPKIEIPRIIAADLGILLKPARVVSHRCGFKTFDRGDLPPFITRRSEVQILPPQPNKHGDFLYVVFMV